MDFTFSDTALLEPVFTSDPYYDLFDGGYIAPKELLADPVQAQKVIDAVNVVRAFLDQAEEAGVIEVG